jgi:hypothetical protein
VVRDEDCPFHRMRRQMQEHYIGVLRTTCKGLNMATLYLAPYEIKGVGRINDVSRALFSDEA